MAIEIISTLKPKNNGTFPIAEAQDISVDDSGTRLDAALSEATAILLALSTPATAIDLSKLDSDGQIIETYPDGTTKTTTIEFDTSGNPVKITDGDGNVTTLTW